MEAKVKKARRFGSVAVILGAVATAAVGNAACGEETTTTGGSAEKPTIGPVANDQAIESPVDATPSPDGKEIYFIANTKVADEDNIGFVRQAAIYKVSASGGPITKLHQGEPLVAPFGITISGDGQTLFIADSGASTSDTRSDGRVYSLGAGGGAPSPLGGTEGLAPGGVEVAGDSLYITGRKDGKAGLFKTGMGGGNVTAVAVGEAFVDPSGVAIARNGDAYVVDSGSATHGQALASVVKVTVDGKTEVVIDGLSVGHPAGVALSMNDQTLYVSGFDSAKGTDVVFTVNAVTKEIGQFTDTIADFAESAGLHRARNTGVFAWADGHANGTGTVFVLRGQ
jgi:sugar lactone lactonase YvrE